MPTIPEPEALMELALSTIRNVEDREWKKYQRYLAKHEKEHKNTRGEEPLGFEDFCVWLSKKDLPPQDTQFQE